METQHFRPIVQQADTLTVNNAGAGTLSLDLTDGALLLNGTTRIANDGTGSFISGTTIGSQIFY